jgi:hypothetical protein
VKTLTYEVGILLCRQVRDFLKMCKFVGYNIDWIESSGWFERTFTIKGDDAHIDRIIETILEWDKENN